MHWSMESQLTQLNMRENFKIFSEKRNKPTRFIEIEPYEGDSYKSPDGMPLDPTSPIYECIQRERSIYLWQH